MQPTRPKTGAFPRAPWRQATRRWQSGRGTRIDAAHGGSSEQRIQVGNWELVRLIERTEQFELHEARQLDWDGSLPCDYAVKLSRPDLDTRPRERSIAALRREVLVSRQVAHPHLASALDWHFGDESNYLVLPGMHGISLRELLDFRRREEGCLIGAARGLPQSIWLVRQAAQGLAALHAAGWLHGDVKPEHLRVSPQGHATLVELGLARRLGTDECLRSDVLMGTLGYLAPEVILQHVAVDGASDIYSLGVVLYELVAGEPPFAAADPAQLALAHLRRAPQDVREFCLSVPPALALLLQRMLAKEPLRRPSAGEVVSRLARLEIAMLAEG